MGPGAQIVRYLARRPADTSLDDSGAGWDWLLIVSCPFSAVLSGWLVPGGGAALPDVLGWPPVRLCRAGSLPGRRGGGAWAAGGGRGATRRPPAQSSPLPR